MNHSKKLIEKMRAGGKCIVGMVHCLPLPGTLNYCGDVEAIYAQALSDAAILEKAGVDAVMVENTNDKPYSARLEPEQLAVLAAVTRLVVERVSVPVGVDASFNDGLAGIAIACAANASFIRSAVFVDTMQATGLGLMTPCARELVRYRRLLGAERIGVWADVQVKHSHSVLPGISMEESAQIAHECGAEVLIVTGVSTGHETPMEKVERVKKATDLPVVIGSGFRYSNVSEQLSVADGAIVGSSMKTGGITTNPIDPVLSAQLMAEVRRIEGKKAE
jgi:membrane complex biogenesis BtpA family protein